MPALGFTLIELLIVISIVAIMSLVGVASFREFAANQVAPKASGEVQSVIRLAQSNATTSTLCNNVPAFSWTARIDLTNNKIQLYCNTAATPATYILQRDYPLTNAHLTARCSDQHSDIATATTDLTYTTGMGKLSTNCNNGASVNITITNSSNADAAPQTLKVSRGGAINVQ